MDITERVIGTATILDVRGSLYGLDVGCRLERAIERLSRAGQRTVIANLEHVPAIDAAGLGALVAAYRESVGCRVSCRLARASRRTRHLIVATRLSRILKTFDSLEDALEDEPPMRMLPRLAPWRWPWTEPRWST